jgi:hypothetical protein
MLGLLQVSRQRTPLQRLEKDLTKKPENKNFLGEKTKTPQKIFFPAGVG